ncbi:hypothetical protein, partial [Microbispora sp. NPDC049125]|uniref:hypothetical protein n=1 Tax=Microbispora sp. NPDC049125 TaxID=3154929 RepID=UPI00346505FA
HATMPQPHLIIWTSPLGHTYQARLPKIITPLPRPSPRHWPDEQPPTDDNDAAAPDRIWHNDVDPHATSRAEDRAKQDTAAQKKDDQKEDDRSDANGGALPFADVPPF